MSTPEGKAMLEAAKAGRKDKTVCIEVPEFSGDGEDVVKVYGSLATIKDRSEILRQSTDAETGHVDQFEAAVRTVIRLALNEQGEKLFTLDSLQYLRTQVPADVIEALAYRLNAGLSYQAAKKN